MVVNLLALKLTDVKLTSISIFSMISILFLAKTSSVKLVNLSRFWILEILLQPNSRLTSFSDNSSKFSITLILLDVKYKVCIFLRVFKP